MSYPVLYVPSGDVVPVMFATYAGATGASITLTGLAVTDIEIYRDGGVTQRASDAGYVLLDTDGIDFDTITGIHGFSIDTGDNTDAGFYTVGAWFTVVVSAVTIDAQTVNFIACMFRLMPAESVAGKPKVDVDAWLGTAAATPTVAGVPEVDLTHIAGAAVSTTTAQLGVNVVQLSTDAAAADNAEAFFDGTGYAGTGNTIPTVTTLTNLPSIPANWLTAAGTAADFGTEIGTAVWATATRTLTALTGGTVAADIRTALGMAAADLDTQLDDLAAALVLIDDFVDDLEGRITAALATTLGAYHLAVGRAVIGAGSTTTAVVLSTVNGAAPSATNDFYNGRVLIYTSGALALQAVAITDYVGATTTLTTTASTGAPADTVTAVIV